MNLKELVNLKVFKYRNVISVGPTDTVAVTIEKMAEHDRGSLPVCDEKGKLVGIISERDIVRKLYASKCASADKTQVKEIMSKEVIIGKAGDDLSYAINVMKEKRIRHLPVMDGRNLIGMISMRDLLGVELEESRTEVQLLNDYMFGANR